MMNVTGPMKLQMKWLSTLNQQLERRNEIINHHTSNYYNHQHTATFGERQPLPLDSVCQPCSWRHTNSKHFQCLNNLPKQVWVIVFIDINAIIDTCRSVSALGLTLFNFWVHWMDFKIDFPCLMTFPVSTPKIGKSTDT